MVPACVWSTEETEAEDPESKVIGWMGELWIQVRDPASIYKAQHDLER